jgi:hypothetical protein
MRLESTKLLRMAIALLKIPVSGWTWRGEMVDFFEQQV